MAIDFPAGATNNQIFVAGGKTWIYNTTTTSWAMLSNLGLDDFLLIGA